MILVNYNCICNTMYISQCYLESKATTRMTADRIRLFLLIRIDGLDKLKSPRTQDVETHFFTISIKGRLVHTQLVRQRIHVLLRNKYSYSAYVL